MVRADPLDRASYEPRELPGWATSATHVPLRFVARRLRGALARQPRSFDLADGLATVERMRRQGFAVAPSELAASVVHRADLYCRAAAGRAQ
jgi:hypothetical protein